MNTQLRGYLAIATTDREGFFFRGPVFATTAEKSEEFYGGIDTDVNEAPSNMPDWYNNPNHFFLPLDVDGDAPILIFNYEDQLRKSYPLTNEYEITLVVAYMQRNEEVDQLPQNEQQQVYDRAIRNYLSGLESTEA